MRHFEMFSIGTSRDLAAIGGTLCTLKESRWGSLQLEGSLYLSVCSWRLLIVHHQSGQEAESAIRVWEMEDTTMGCLQTRASPMSLFSSPWSSNSQEMRGPDRVRNTRCRCSIDAVRNSRRNLSGREEKKKEGKRENAVFGSTWLIMSLPPLPPLGPGYDGIVWPGPFLSVGLSDGHGLLTRHDTGERLTRGPIHFFLQKKTW